MVGRDTQEGKECGQCGRGNRSWYGRERGGVNAKGGDQACDANVEGGDQACGGNSKRKLDGPVDCLAQELIYLWTNFWPRNDSSRDEGSM